MLVFQTEDEHFTIDYNRDGIFSQERMFMVYMMNWQLEIRMNQDSQVNHGGHCKN